MSVESRRNVIAPVVHAPPRPTRLWIVVLLILGLGSTILLTTLAGNRETWLLLWSATPAYIALMAVAQTGRYVAMTISTRTLAMMALARVAWFPLFQVTVAAQALNRTFVGGAAGFALRLAYFIKQGMAAGTFAAMEVFESLAGLCSMAFILTSGIVLLTTLGGVTPRGDLLGVFLGGIVLLAVLGVLLARQRAWVEKLADALARLAQATLGRLVRRTFYDRAKVQQGVANFYSGLALARKSPWRLVVVFLCALARHGADALTLYFAFRALGYEIPPGAVLVIFAVSSSVATLAAVPGQIGVIESALVLTSTTLGVPPPVAVGASLLYRLVSFWLPIPFGYAFAWRLERKGMF